MVFCEGGACSELPLTLRTVGEISLAMGYHPATSDDATPREQEVAHEQAFLSHDLSRFEEAENVGGWSFVLRRPVDAEAAFLDQPPAMLRKIALCRRLQIQVASE